MDDARVAMQPLMSDLETNGGLVLQETYVEINVNDAVTATDGSVGLNLFMGSRLIPESVYRESPGDIGTMYEKLFAAGSYEYEIVLVFLAHQANDDALHSVLGHLVAGGR